MKDGQIWFMAVGFKWVSQYFRLEQILENFIDPLFKCRVQLRACQRHQIKEEWKTQSLWQTSWDHVGCYLGMRLLPMKVLWNLAQTRFVSKHTGKRACDVDQFSASNSDLLYNSRKSKTCWNIRKCVKICTLAGTRPETSVNVVFRMVTVF